MIEILIRCYKCILNIFKIKGDLNQFPSLQKPHNNRRLPLHPLPRENIKEEQQRQEQEHRNLHSREGHKRLHRGELTIKGQKVWTKN